MEDQKKEESMLVEYKQEVDNSKWEVIVGKKSFILNGNQILILKKMSLAGKSSIVWFGNFAISVPHISSIEQIWGAKIFTDFDKKALERFENDKLG